MIFAGVDLPPNGRAALRTLANVGDSDVQFMDVTGGSFSQVFEHVKACIHVQRQVVVV